MQAKAAEREVVQLFETAVIAAPGGRRAWGQVFDSPGGQYGIFGTSAGVQVLAPSYGETHTLVSNATALLDLLDDAGSVFRKKKDHLNTYKLIARVEATSPTAAVVPSIVPATSALVAAALPGGGWGDYAGQTGNPDPNPTEVATSLALYSLRRFTSFRGSPQCTAALEWLSERILSRRSWEPTDLEVPTLFAVALLAMQPYTDAEAGKIVNGLKPAIIKCRQSISRWSRYRPPEFVCEQFRHDFIEEGPYKRGGDFVALIPDCVASLALLESPEQLTYRTRTYVRKVVYRVSRDIVGSRFRPRNVRRRAALDHLWAQRVLRAYLASPRHSHLLLAHVRSWGWFRFIVTEVFLLILSIACFARVSTTQGWKNSTLYVFGTLSAGTVIGLFATRFSGTRPES
ncbi:MAG: hypothetical protein ACJ757_13440 [Gaiellaceae bacterium]